MLGQPYSDCTNNTKLRWFKTYTKKVSSASPTPKRMSPKYELGHQHHFDITMYSELSV